MNKKREKPVSSVYGIVKGECVSVGKTIASGDDGDSAEHFTSLHRRLHWEIQILSCSYRDICICVSYIKMMLNICEVERHLLISNQARFPYVMLHLPCSHPSHAPTTHLHD